MVVPDLHSSPERLIHLKTFSEQAQASGGTTLLMGDVIDRGAAGKETYEWIRQEVEAGRLHLLSGNHEAMAWAWASGDEQHADQKIRSSAQRLTRIWHQSAVGGRQWTAQLGGEAAARQAVQWLADHSHLMATIKVSHGVILAVHAQVPGLITMQRLEERHQALGRPLKLSDLNAHETDLSQASSDFLWANPVEGSPNPGEVICVVHGHIEQQNPRAITAEKHPHTGPRWKTSVMLDLNKSTRLAALWIEDGHQEILSLN